MNVTTANSSIDSIIPVESTTNMESQSSIFDNSTSSDVAKDPEPNYVLQQLMLMRSFYTWSNSIIIPIGIVGNILVMKVVSQKQNRSISCSIYMGALAMSDTMVLLAGASGISIMWGIPSSQRNLVILCKALAVSQNTFFMIGVMIILALLVERVIAVTKPMKAAVLLSPTRRVTVICIIAVICPLFNVPRIFFASVGGHAASGIRHCVAFPKANLLATIYDMVNFVVVGLLPLLAIFIMNIMILFVVKSSKNVWSGQKYIKPQQKNHPDPVESEENIGADKISTICKSGKTEAQNKAKYSKLEKQLTLMCLVMTFAFTCCTIPRHVHTMRLIRMDYENAADKFMSILWPGSTANVLYIMNSAINCFLYCISGAKFRADVVKLFCRKSSTLVDSAKSKPATQLSSVS